MPVAATNEGNSTRGQYSESHLYPHLALPHLFYQDRFWLYTPAMALSAMERSSADRHAIQTMPSSG